MSSVLGVTWAHLSPRPPPPQHNPGLGFHTHHSLIMGLYLLSPCSYLVLPIFQQHRGMCPCPDAPDFRAFVYPIPHAQRVLFLLPLSPAPPQPGNFFKTSHPCISSAWKAVGTCTGLLNGGVRESVRARLQRVSQLVCLGRRARCAVPCSQPPPGGSGGQAVPARGAPPFGDEEGGKGSALLSCLFLTCFLAGLVCLCACSRPGTFFFISARPSDGIGWWPYGI